MPFKLESEDGGRLMMVVVALSTSLLIATIASILVMENLFVVLRYYLAAMEFDSLTLSAREVTVPLSASISDHDFKISPDIFAADRVLVEMVARRLLSVSSSFFCAAPMNFCISPCNMSVIDVFI